MGPMKDAVLDRLFLRYRARGDGKALAAVFDLTAKELFAVAAHLASGAGEAEDLVQIVFLRAMERAQAFDPARGLRPWLHGILWREALAARRRAARRFEAAELERSSSEDPAEIALERELPVAVRDALARLPQRYREVVEPLLLEDRPARRDRGAVGRSSGTVRMQIHRGLERLRRALPRGLSASGLVLPTRGWDELRASLLRQAGIPSTTVGRSRHPCSRRRRRSSPCRRCGSFRHRERRGARRDASAPASLPSTSPPEVAAAIDPGERIHEAPSSSSHSPRHRTEWTGSPLPRTTASPSPSRASREGVAGRPRGRAAHALRPAERGRRCGVRVARGQGRIDAEVQRRASLTAVPADYALTRTGSRPSSLADSARREAALTIRPRSRAIPERQLAACNALHSSERRSRKQSFREPVLAIARNSTGQLRVRASARSTTPIAGPRTCRCAGAGRRRFAAVLESGLHLLFLSATAS
jgi:RNA polymerase sigma-70 factor (ECF subfamily)